MYNIQDYSVIYNNAAHSVICEGRVHKTNLILPLFIEVPASTLESERSYVYCAPCCLCVLTPYDLDGQKFHDMTQRVSSKKRERYNIIRLNNKYTTKSNRKSQKQ
jgi:hypothetical protein